MSSVIGLSSVLVVVAWLLGFAPIRTKRPGHRTSVKSPRSWMQPWWDASAGLLVVLCGAALLLDADDLSLGTAGLLPQLVGLLLALAATVLCIRAGVELGENFAPGLQTWNEQQMVTRGVYGFVRHPIYLATIALWLGTGLAMSSWLLLLVGMFFVLPTFWLMARQEERLMADRFGRAYGDYQARVPMLFPSSWTGRREDTSTGRHGDGKTGRAEQKAEEVQDETA